MKILYLGSSHGTSLYRANALVRLGHKVSFNAPDVALKQLGNRYLGIFHYQTGFRFLQPFIINWLKKIILTIQKTDLVWVDGGEWLGRNALRVLKDLSVPVILFNHDDPTGTRDGRRFDTLKKSLDLYDLIVAVRNDTEKELLSYGGKPFRIWRTYDEIAHSPDLVIQPIPSHLQSDVCFIGTNFRYENRDKFLLGLIERNIDLAIWGGQWERSPYWHRLQPHWRGNGLFASDYVTAIQGSKICIGMVSKRNRDLHTTRTMEIPYAGGLFCAERTSEHLELYKEDEEAVFWSDVDECADKCLNLLAHSEKRERIRLAGMRRVRENKVGNEDICRQIISEVCS